MAVVTAAAIGVGTSIIGGAVGAHQASQAARGARNDAARSRAEMEAIRKARQPITNPYANTKDISGMAKDLSGMITNPYANLGVATQAAKFEAEQIDMSLANTLDTLRETGSSAGGATALAQAALKSKQGISANIERQEAQNEKLKAEGKQQMDMLKMQEATRIQGIQISEGQRVQTAEAQGKAFVFGAKEDRETAAIDRVAGQLGIAGQQQAQANADTIGAITSGIGALGAVGGAMASRTANPNTANKLTTTGEGKNSVDLASQGKVSDHYNNNYTDTSGYANGPAQLNSVGQSPTSLVDENPDFYDQQMYQLPG